MEMRVGERRERGGAWGTEQGRETGGRRWRKQGQFFSFDAAMGAFLVGVILIAVTIDVSRRYNPADIQTEKIGYDILTIIDYEGRLASLDSASIDARAGQIISQQYASRYGMRINLTGNFNSFEVGDQIPDAKTVISGKRVFVNASAEVNGIATFWIWQI